MLVHMDPSVAQVCRASAHLPPLYAGACGLDVMPSAIHVNGAANPGALCPGTSWPDSVSSAVVATGTAEGLCSSWLTVVPTATAVSLTTMLRTR